MDDMGWKMKLRLWSDSSAAKAMGARRGLGKLVRHIEVKMLWLQEAVRRKRLTWWKIDGEKNPADVLTKPVGWKDMKMKLEIVSAHLMWKCAT